VTIIAIVSAFLLNNVTVSTCLGFVASYWRNTCVVMVWCL